MKSVSDIQEGVKTGVNGSFNALAKMVSDITGVAIKWTGYVVISLIIAAVFFAYVSVTPPQVPAPGFWNTKGFSMTACKQGVPWRYSDVELVNEGYTWVAYADHRKLKFHFDDKYWYPNV